MLRQCSSENQKTRFAFNNFLPKIVLFMR